MLKIIGLCRGRSILLSCYPAEGMNKIMTKQACDHVNNIEENIASRTNGCEEFEKEGTDWVALRMCLSCGQVDAAIHLLVCMQQNTFRRLDIP